MSKYLVQTVELYRVDSEAEVARMIEDAKKDPKFTLHKYQSEKKDVKVKGEVVDCFYRVQLTKVFNDIKDPDCTVDITYTKENGVFPSPVEKTTTDEDEEDGDEPTW